LKFRIEEWFSRVGVTSSEEQFSYIVIASEDDILRAFIEKKNQLKGLLL